VEGIQYLIGLVVIVAYVLGHIYTLWQEEKRKQEALLPAPPIEPAVAERLEAKTELEQRVEKSRGWFDELGEPKPAVPVAVLVPSPPIELPRPVPPVRVQLPPPIKPVPSVPVVAAAPATTGAARQVLNLLKQRRSVAAAVLLTEILGRPVSQRPRRRF